ncbi:unnamed protein product, partial [Mesorhabditis spiculigera]
MNRRKSHRNLLIWALAIAQMATAQLIRGQPPVAENLVTPRRIKVNEGAAFELSCPTMDEDVEYFWLKDDQDIGASKKLFHIVSASSDHVGIYHCVARNAFGAAISRTYLVDVQYLHDFADSTDSSISVTGNSAFILRRPELIAAKSARPTFSWYRNDVEIFSNTSRYVTSRGDLVVLDDGLPMDGSYRVTAWLDALGEAASGVFFVSTDNTARTENPFSIIYGPADLELLDDEGPEMAEFDCVPSYSSDFNIHWYIDGEEATEEHRGINQLGKALGEDVSIRCSLKDGIGGGDTRWWHNGKKLAARDGILTLNKINADDFGVYQCEGRNLAGSTVSTLWLHEGQEDKRTHSGGTSLIEHGPTNQSILIGTNIEIPCEASKDLGADVEVKWSLNGESIGPSGNQALRIERKKNGGLLIIQAAPDNIGEYICTIRTPRGEQSQSAWLRIIERPSMPVAVAAQLINETVPAKIKNCCSWVIDNLKPSATAEFRVIAFNRYGAGMPSVSTNNVTMPQQPPASAPIGVAASARSSSSIMVQWQPPPSEQWNGDILGYIIRYRLSGYALPWNEKNVTNINLRSVPIEPLITWRTYEIQVAAYNNRGLGVFSKSVDVTTLEGVPSQAPSRVKAVAKNSTAFEITFSAPDQQRIPGVNLGYKIQFWRGAPGAAGGLRKQVIIDPTGPELSLVVDGLEKWGHYNLSILCFTGPGDGPRSETQLVVTEEDTPGPVSELGVDHEQVLSNSAVLQWHSPQEANGRIIGYELNYWRSERQEDRLPLELPGDQHSVMLEGLTPSTQYAVEIRAKTSKGVGPWAETRFESGVPPELPGRPTSLSIVQISPRSAQLQFVPGFDGHTTIRQWIVEARVGESNIFHQIYNVSAPKARLLNVTDLRPYTRYQLRLIADNVVGRGSPSEPSQAFETKQTIPEAPSSRLWFEPISATSMILSWTPLQHWQWNGQPTGYLIVYRQNGTKEWREIRVSSLRATDFTLRDLRPFTSYEADLYAENIVGKSQATGSTVAKTYESFPSGAPTDVAASLGKDGHHSITVQWKPVDNHLKNGDILGYKVRLVPEQPELRDEYEKSVDVIGEATNVTKLAGLRAFTAYNVFVAAYTVVGSGPENASPTTIKTGIDLPTEPTSVGFSFISEEEARLRWLPPANPNGRILKYIITYVRADENKDSEITIPMDSNSYAFSANGLSPNSKYLFTVKAENEMGFGPEASVEVKTTAVQLPLRNPPVPSRDERKPFASREVHISWPELITSDEDAPVRFVQIEYQRANENDWVPYTDSTPAKENRVTIKRLKPNTPYRVRIRFRGDFAQSAWSSESEWIKTLGARPEAPPGDLATAPFESDGILLQWAPPDRSAWNSDVLGYRISYKAYPSNDSWQSTEIAPRHEQEPRERTTIRGLKSFHHYVVSMKSLNADGGSEASTPVFVYVGYSIPRGNVTGLSAEPSSSTQLRLRWDEWRNEEDVITGFKIRYVPLISVLSRQPQEEQLLIVENNTALLTDLMKFTQYQVSVSPYNRAGEGGMAVIRETTLQDIPGPVGNLMFEDVLLDSVNVSWSVPEEPNGRIIRYIVNYYTSKLQDEFLKNIKQPTQMPFIVATGLEEGATYYFSVRAETTAGTGPEAAGNVTIGSTSDGPEAPTRPRAVPGHTSVALQWTDGAATARGIIGHLIQAKRVANAEPTTTVKTTKEKRVRRSAYEPPTHRMGEWVTLSTIMGSATGFEISYKDLHSNSYYVFRVFARNRRGVGKASVESDQLFVPATLPEDPFFTQLWFIAIVGMATLLIIISVVAFLCITGNSKKGEKRHGSLDSLQLADGNLTTFHLKQNNDRISRSRNDLLTRPGTTTSWISDREPPAYGSVLGANNGVSGMYGQLATDVIPRGAETANQRLSALAGRDVRGSVYARGVTAPTARADLLSPRGNNEHENSDGFDSFDEEENESERGVDPGNDIAGHYNHSDSYSATWRRVRAREAANALSPAPTNRRPSTTASFDHFRPSRWRLFKPWDWQRFFMAHPPSARP